MADSDKKTFTISTAQLADGPAVHEIVKNSHSLDVNSRYCYLLLCSHFNRYCLIFRTGQKMSGFVLAYPQPHSPGTIFVWQVAVDPGFRQQGIGLALLRRLVQLAGDNGLNYLETTITPSNLASHALFGKLAKIYDANYTKSSGFPRSLFEDGHEEEELIKIGPIKGPIKTKGEGKQ